MCLTTILFMVKIVCLSLFCCGDGVVEVVLVLYNNKPQQNRDKLYHYYKQSYNDYFTYVIVCFEATRVQK